MKLNSDDIAAVEDASDLFAVTEDNPTYNQLLDIFGAHTCFVNDEGLFIFEGACDEAGATVGEAYLFTFAKWKEEGSSKLILLQEPVPTGVVLDLENQQLQNVDDAAPTIH